MRFLRSHAVALTPLFTVFPGIDGLAEFVISFAA
jgi:hypothetical protein